MVKKVDEFMDILDFMFTLKCLIIYFVFSPIEDEYLQWIKNLVTSLKLRKNCRYSIVFKKKLQINQSRKSIKNINERNMQPS